MVPLQYENTLSGGESAADGTRIAPWKYAMVRCRSCRAAA